MTVGRTTMTRRRAVGAVLAVLLTVASPATAQDVPADAGMLAYTRHGDIVVVAADGAGRSRETRGAAWDASPVWSPDGSRIAFIRCCSSVWRPGGSALMVADADGGGLQEISQDLRGRVHETSWSPDGRLLLYSDVIHKPDGTYRASIRVTNVEGTEFRRLTGYRSNNVGAQWSPDGSSILFMSDRSGDMELYLMSPDATWHHRLTDAEGEDWAAAWSPDGTRIAYVHESEEFGWSSHLVVLDVATGSTRQLTVGDVLDTAPTWHPDGRTLAFQRFGFEPEYDAALWTVEVDGGEPARLVTADGGAAWSPSGNTIAFVRGDDLWTIGADGKGQRQLTTTSLYEGNPSWRPGGLPAPLPDAVMAP
jgi:TolB protein